MASYKSRNATPIKLEAARVNIAESDGLRVIHAVGGEGDSASLIRIIEAIEYGWEHEDSSLFATFSHRSTGDQNQTDSVEPQSDARQGVELSLSNIETHVDGDYAWSVAEVDMQGSLTANGNDLHDHGHETFLFHRVGGTWRVIHTHGSHGNRAGGSNGVVYR